MRIGVCIGSSPRLRGTVLVNVCIAVFLRFIPAPAGNSRAGHAVNLIPPVHPRACGEQALRETAIALGTGSSPRLRGTASRDSRRCSQGRFIPAPAGNRLTVMSMMWFDLQAAMISTSFRLG